MSKAIVNIHVQVFMWTDAFSSPVKTGMCLLGHIWFVKDSKVGAPFCNPSSNG